MQIDASFNFDEFIEVDYDGAYQTNDTNDIQEVNKMLASFILGLIGFGDIEYVDTFSTEKLILIPYRLKLKKFVIGNRNMFLKATTMYNKF